MAFGAHGSCPQPPTCSCWCPNLQHFNFMRPPSLQDWHLCCSLQAVLGRCCLACLVRTGARGTSGDEAVSPCRQSL